MARLWEHLRIHHLLIVLVVTVCSVVQTQAQGIGMVTGSKTGTYIRFGRDIAKVAKNKGVDIIVKKSEGSLANIRRMMSKENAALGIVQSDVLGFLSTSSDSNMRHITSRLRLVFPFYNEEVHLFARKEIQQLVDLNGKRVVVGTKGSGNWLTANNILRLANVDPGERLEMPPSTAVSAVLTGKADAMFYVAGKPVTVFTRIRGLLNNPDYAPLVQHVHFVPLDDPMILNEYVASDITTNDYSWLNGDVQTAAVKAVLVSFDFSSKRNTYFRQRCRQLEKLGEAIREQFDHLTRTGHPKWQEVDLEQQVGIWQRDTCSSPDAVAMTQPVAAAKTAPAPKSADADALMKAIENILTTDSR
ncbi:TAXI family TRAP transporter solute-binding subunit [Candidatus Entotheonella palauensis]|uniref:TAXI family TRAP transporter solute-binding subunit n=1 Tax=Candidatus Entotheonella palauensis TaxID=93172 RepID=UPI0015C438C8|nr:TAXI family TRAP transporter solute-binding subunit [Candidatus Entotheonella palauensis]